MFVTVTNDWRNELSLSDFLAYIDVAYKRPGGHFASSMADLVDARDKRVQDLQLQIARRDARIEELEEQLDGLCDECPCTCGEELEASVLSAAPSTVLNITVNVDGQVQAYQLKQQLDVLKERGLI